MTAKAMWEQFASAHGISDQYSAWSFGDDADTLARLVLEGIKTATASAYPLYAMEGEALPQTGEYSVILNSAEEAVCIIRTTRVFILPFDAVDSVQAWKEGEGDRSLAYWRSAHARFFRQCMEESGLTFDEKMPVVCEEFIRVYP